MLSPCVIVWGFEYWGLLFGVDSGLVEGGHRRQVIDWGLVVIDSGLVGGSSQFENNCFTEMCSDSEAGSHFRLIDAFALRDRGGGHTSQEDDEVSPTQNRISPSMQRILRLSFGV